MITDGTFAALRAAATSGDLDAARELGRLLCLLPADPAGPAPDPGPEPTWPEEPWLRTVVDARPEDVFAAGLLAGRLVQQTHYLLNGYGEDEGAVDSKRNEAELLYTRVLGADPTDRTAVAGLARLADLFTNDLPTGPPEEYGFYLAEYGYQSGGGGGSAYLVVADPGELRWALDAWLKLNDGVWDEDGGLGGAWFTLTTVARGLEENEIDLEAHILDGRIDWDQISIPPLSAPPLPAGHPGRFDELDYDHGYSVVAG